MTAYHFVLYAFLAVVCFLVICRRNSPGDRDKALQVLAEVKYAAVFQDFILEKVLWSPSTLPCGMSLYNLKVLKDDRVETLPPK